MFWSFVFYLAIYVLSSPGKIRQLFQQKPKDWLLSALAAALITLNWWLYIYAVNTGHILEGSLAYFINPMLNVAVGVVFFKEKFPWPLKLAVFLAAAGVLIKITYADSLPWLSIVLAITFCTYGIVKKISQIPARTSSVLEGSVIFIPAFIGIVWFRLESQLALQATDILLLVFSGVVTGVPLFLFSFAAQRIPYSIMGMMQFVAPTLQFLVGIYMFKEDFNKVDQLVFGLIWMGMLFYIFQQMFNLKLKTNKTRQ